MNNLFSRFLATSVTSAIMLATLPAFAVPSEPALQITKPIYSWKTESQNDENKGTLNHCLVKNMYDNGTVLMLAENTDGVRRLALHFPQDKMESGQHFDLTAQIDKRDVFPVEAIAITPRVMTVAIPSSLPDQMRKGDALYLRGPNDQVVYQLKGMDGAVSALHDCIVSNQGRPALTDNNGVVIADAGTASVGQEAAPVPAINDAEAQASVAMAPAPVAPEPVQAEPEKTAEKPAPMIAETTPGLLPSQWQAAFAGTPWAPEKLLLIRQPTSAQPLDFAWRKDEMLIGLKEKSASSLETGAVDYMRMMKQRCNGEFVAEASGIVPGKGNLSTKMAELACANNKGTDSIAAMLFTSAGDNKIRIYFFETPAIKGGDAIRARNDVLKNVMAQ
ncbi:MAG: hypothetical protein JWM96_968 [Alphaproteobacteria bacterium]|nr:hypothetical protein [Alphaproteobacteria bacterium]